MGFPPNTSGRAVIRCNNLGSVITLPFHPVFQWPRYTPPDDCAIHAKYRRIVRHRCVLVKALVWPKNSCSFTFGVFEEASNPCTTPKRACGRSILADCREEEDVALALMISLVMIMFHIRVESMPQGAFAKEEQPCQRFVFDRAYPALRVGMQVGRSGW